MAGFVPPPYPHDRLGALTPLRRRGARRDGRRVGRHARRSDARRRAARARRRCAGRHRVPGHHRQRSRYRDGGGGVDRPPVRLHRHPRRGGRVHRHQGARGVAARGCCRCATRRATPCCTRRSRTRPTRWAPRSRACARCRCRSTSSWHLDLGRVDPADAERALVLWLNDPSNPTGVGGVARRDARRRSSGRGRGASSSPATSATPSSPTTPTARPPLRSPRSAPGTDGVLAVHSLSKRSNMAGLRAGFVAGDRDARRLPG